MPVRQTAKTFWFGGGENQLLKLGAIKENGFWPILNLIRVSEEK